MEVGEASSPPEPMNVSEEIVEHVDSDMSNSDEFIADPNIPTRPKWESKTIHGAGELARILMTLGGLDFNLRVLCA